MLAAMIARGSTDGVVSAADRERWNVDAATMLAGRSCGCGRCPSIELLDESGGEIMGPDRLLLSGWIDADSLKGAATLLLFIDGGRPSYLELAPLADNIYAEFPDPAVMTPY